MIAAAIATASADAVTTCSTEAMRTPGVGSLVVVRLRLFIATLNAGSIVKIIEIESAVLGAKIGYVCSSIGVK